MDLRTIKTEKLIEDTFKQMLCETDIRKITVKELAERCYINGRLSIRTMKPLIY